MSQFVVQHVASVEPFENQYGSFDPASGKKYLYSVKMSGLLDGQTEPSVQINVKDPKNAPQVGQAIECLIDKRDSYGVKIKKPQNTVGAPAPVPAQNAPQGGTPAAPVQTALPFQREDPTVRQASIERQNSLTNAIAYCTAKAQALIAAKKAEEAATYLEGKKVLQVATYFASYNNGKVTVVMTPEEVASVFGYEDTTHPYQDEEEGDVEYV